MKIRRAYGIPSRIVQSISDLDDNTSAKVLTPDGETDTFPILAGVQQGDTLAPYLFIVILDYALRRVITGKEEKLGFTITPGKSRRVKPVTQTDFDYADDIALVSDSVEKTQALLLSVESECQKMGLQLNAKKAEASTRRPRSHPKMASYSQ